MMIFSNRLLQFLCQQVTSAFSRSFFFEPFRKQFWKKQAFHWHLFMGCCHFFKLSVIWLSRMGGRLQWNIFSWDEVGRHSGEQLCWEPLLLLREWVKSDMGYIKDFWHMRLLPPPLIGLFSRHFYPIVFLLQFNPTSEADLVHRHDSSVHCRFLLMPLPILHIYLKY